MGGIEWGEWELISNEWGEWMGILPEPFLYRFFLNAGFFEPAAGGNFLGFKVQNGKIHKIFSGFVRISSRRMAGMEWGEWDRAPNEWGEFPSFPPFNGGNKILCDTSMGHQNQ